ncbi:hypothetical protein OC846_000283 [Tilletia horrida]|uniref:Uncharacterized protein n=1 Tax=Tilletia horrida TaxID=155126 RepID=A0AAN6GV60_9BASI|nr:hypothetical protein OC845_002971 [Tilletia horrida]KAK0557716.1 hypothetical protein OC846_000283 [Tilletia horrida]KAK0570309.1 hypothetical protein OC861_000052 [Tilletia horrida]
MTEQRPFLRRTEFGSFAEDLANAADPHALPMSRTESDESDMTKANESQEFADQVPQLLSSHKLDSEEHLFPRSKSSASMWNPDAVDIKHVLYASHSERGYVPPLMLLGPVLGVLFLTAGLATCMVIWVKINMLPLSSAGVIFVREAAEIQGDRTYHDPVLGSASVLKFEEQIAGSTTLSISSAISTLVGNSVFPLMGLVTYSLASSWLQLQTDIAHRGSLRLTEQLPTPLQYALLTQICGANSFEALYNTIRHLIRSRRTRTTIPSILKQAFAWLTSLLLLSSVIAALDVYLHETMRTVQVVDISPKASFQNFTWGLNTSLCDASTLNLVSNPCLTSGPNPPTGAALPVWAEGGGFPDDYVEPEGWLVANNASRDHSVLTTTATLPGLPGSQSLAFVASPRVSTGDIFSSQTIGLSSTCRMLTKDCHPQAQSFDCADVGEPQISVGSTTTTYSTGAQGSNIASTLFLSFPNGTAMLGAQASVGAQTNPQPVSALLTYSMQLEVDPATDGFENFDVGPGQVTWMYGALACSLSAYSLDMSYFNGTYEVVQAHLADAGLLHALSGPLVSGAITEAVASSLARVVGRVPADEFASLFGTALSYNALSFASGMLQAAEVKVNSWKPILASQYSLPALVSYLALLYTYSICAVVLFFWAWGMSSDCVEYDDPASGTRKAVPAVVLAQRQLMDPGHIIALHLSSGPAPPISAAAQEPGPAGSAPSPPSADQEKCLAPFSKESSAAVRTIGTDILDLFEDVVQPERVVVGLEGKGRGFGVWPLLRAPGAVGRDGRNRESLLRSHNLFWNSKR